MLRYYCTEKERGHDTTIAPTIIYEALFAIEKLTEDDIEKAIALIQENSNCGLASFFSFHEELKELVLGQLLDP
ncbi:hypothetical protein, partial [Okeania sp. SIO2B3]|uniref:hypothetical protein n=1 Tax=Okeania sp. SIO2B3 TaxID=2607784 RepID=UPI0013C15ADF